MLLRLINDGEGWPSMPVADMTLGFISHVNGRDMVLVRERVSQHEGEKMRGREGESEYRWGRECACARERERENHREGVSGSI